MIALETVGSNIPLKAVPFSRDAKLGGMAATYRPVGVTCPSTCMFLNNGCYAQKGRVNIHQAKSGAQFDELNKLLAHNQDIVRHHVSGDFFSDDRLDIDYLESVIAWHKANPKVHGYAYTHRISAFIDAGYTPETLPSNLTIVASADSDGDAELATLYGFAYTRIEEDEESALASRKRGEVVCPNQTAKKRGKTVTCRQCKYALKVLVTSFSLSTKRTPQNVFR